jgi:hypothetical protein
MLRRAAIAVGLVGLQCLRVSSLLPEEDWLVHWPPQPVRLIEDDAGEGALSEPWIRKLFVMTRSPGILSSHFD